MADGVAEQGFGPFEFAHQLFGIGVDQQFVVVEAVAVGRVVSTVHAVAVNQPRMGVGQVAMKGLVGVFGQFDAFQFHFASVVEQAQFDFCGVGREQREVNAQAVPGGAEGEGQTFTNPRRLVFRRRLGVVGLAH